MRRRPTNNGSYSNNNQHKRPQRYQQNGGGEHRSAHHNSGNGHRPRRNYGAAREKYLAQARDALASGDRVLAENYFQHADHCYRMMVEEGQTRPNYTPPPQQGDEASAPAVPAEGNSEHFPPENTNQLPAFITATHELPGQPQPADPVIVQSWEE